VDEKLTGELDTARSSARRGVASTGLERIAALCDPDSFVEYGELAGSSVAEGHGAAASLVCGLGRIGGYPAVIAAPGGVGPLPAVSIAKLDRVLFMAVENGWPFVCFIDAASEAPGGTFGPSLGLGGTRIGLFDGLCELSGRAPVVAILDGTALDRYAAIASLSDFVVAVRGSFLGDSPDACLPIEEHERIGDVDLIVADMAQAVLAARQFVTYLLADEASGVPSPRADSVADVIPENRRRAYDMRRVIEAIADDRSVLELRPNWGTSMITSLARLDGRTVGIFANQPRSRIAGAIDADAADKMARFIELCDAYSVPLLSLIDSPGFHIGPEAERGGIARHHVRTLSALEHRDVPLYCVQIRKAYGLGPLVMRGSWGHLPPEIRLAWPTVETGGMSLEGAAYLARRKEILAAKTPEEARQIRDDYAETLRARDSGLRAGQNFSFDDIIHPAETRDRIIAMLNLKPRVRRAEKKTYLDHV
jgi:acetyl-CoA carboxylase carboxyltransferase component